MLVVLFYSYCSSSSSSSPSSSASSSSSSSPSDTSSPNSLSRFYARKSANHPHPTRSTNPQNKTTQTYLISRPLLLQIPQHDKQIIQLRLRCLPLSLFLLQRCFRFPQLLLRILDFPRLVLRLGFQVLVLCLELVDGGLQGAV
ncbi:hypothetical protein CC80DRAFT_54673 [Byssothecium circinans]|uniref:Uncharacterized protein n=1 Tax=Byssothecium circinans TaxID=147558 RepID=A0A6A5U7L1_9PLEO|nr:hypothetical protein CC80DRAFT_54673 [Byssothecium circinans]